MFSVRENNRNSFLKINQKKNKAMPSIRRTPTKVVYQTQIIQK